MAQEDNRRESEDRAKARHLTTLSEAEEAMVVAFRRHTLLPLDDCLYARARAEALLDEAGHPCFWSAGRSTTVSLFFLKLNEGFLAAVHPGNRPPALIPAASDVFSWHPDAVRRAGAGIVPVKWMGIANS